MQNALPMNRGNGHGSRATPLLLFCQYISLWRHLHHIEGTDSCVARGAHIMSQSRSSSALFDGSVQLLPKNRRRR